MSVRRIVLVNRELFSVMCIVRNWMISKVGRGSRMSYIYTYTR